MYNRDTQVEMKETLSHLVNVMDRLMEVVSKDETSKGIMDLLKEKSGSGKDHKDAGGVAGERADTIIPKVRQRSQATGDNAFDLNFANMRRLNTAFRALEGDMGAFQRTVFNTVAWVNKAFRGGGATADAAAGAAETVMKSPIKTISQALQWHMDDLVKKHGFTQGLGKFYSNQTPAATDIAQLIAQGIPEKTAVKYLNQQWHRDLLKEAQTATAVPVTLGRAAAARQAISSQAGPGAGGIGAGVTGGAGGGGGAGHGGVPGGPVPPGSPPGSSSFWSRFAASAGFAGTVALGTAPAWPLLIGAWGKAGAEKMRKEISEEYGPYSGTIANANATYLFKKKLLDMEYAPVLEKDFKTMTESEARFDRSMKPFYTGLEKIWMKIKTGAMDFASWTNENIFDPIGNALNPFKRLGQDGGNIAAWKFDFAPQVPILGGILGGLGDAMNVWIKQQQLAANANELDMRVAKTEPGTLALQIARTPIAPPRRFVP